MLKVVASLGLLFNESPLPERFGRAAAAGFRTLEMWCPFEWPADELAKVARRAGVELLQFNLDMGDVPGGDRGFLAHPEARERFRSGFELALRYAEKLGVRQLHSLSGNRMDGVAQQDQLACMRDNLEWLAPQLKEHDLRLNIEPLNAFESPKYLFPRPGDLFSALKDWDLPRIGVTYDLYHAQLMEGNLVGTLRQNLPLVGHIQVADAPDRHQPGTGEINFPYIFAQLEALEYARFVSLEYVPLGSTEDSLSWLPRESRVAMRAEDIIL
jgi:hydroxypyruvate isomerase